MDDKYNYMFNNIYKHLFTLIETGQNFQKPMGLLLSFPDVTKAKIILRERVSWKSTKLCI